MQEEKRTFSEFIKRTDRLAHRLGKNVSELPEKLGISKSMLYSYRAGKTPITAKAWAKLEDAEVEEGSESPEKSGFVRSYGDPNEFSSVLRDDVVQYKAGGKRLEMEDSTGNQIALLELAVDSMSAQLHVMRELLNNLKKTL